MKTLLRLALLCAFAWTPVATSAHAEERPRVEQRREKFVSGGRRIRVDVFAPQGRGRHPAVLVFHSAAGTLAGKRQLDRFSRQLAEEGYIAFLVHYFDRTRTLFAGDKAIDAHSATWVMTARDAVDFVAAHPRVRADRIGMFGYSLGAFIAVAESSRDPRIDAIVEIAGGIFAGFRPSMKRLPRTLILHGRNDRRVPVLRAIELARAAHQLRAPVEMKIYEGEGHALSAAAAADATARSLRFFRSTFRD